MIEFLGTAYVFAKEVYGYVKEGKEVLDTAKGAYTAGKDIKEHFEVKELDPKLVDLSWVEKSGFDKASAEAGYTLVWSRPDRVASRELDGYEVMYEVDRDARTRRRLVVRDGLVLLGKKSK